MRPPTVLPTKDGWRYYLVEDDEHLCRKQIKEIDISTNKNRILPAYTKRRVIYPTVKLSENDRAPQLKLSDDHLRVTGEKGYSMARATHGINRGKWYFEVYINAMPVGTAARIGWGQKYANLQAPLGYDEFGYSWRSRFGTKFHQARGKSFDKEGYGEGDVIGCLIDLPYGNERELTEGHHLPPSIKDAGQLLTAKKNWPGSFRILEEKEIVPQKAQLTQLSGSKISFYKNGRLVGVAFEDVINGTYFPTISLYKNCVISPNFGPNFKYPPDEASNDPDKIYCGFKDFQQVPEIEIIDNLISDLFYMVDKHESMLFPPSQATRDARKPKAVVPVAGLAPP